MRRRQGRSGNSSPCPVDGHISDQIMAAVRRYQWAGDLAEGQLTMGTLRRLQMP